MGRRARQEFFPDENLSRKNSPSASLGEVGVPSGEPVCNPAGFPTGGFFVSSETLSRMVCSVL